MRLSFAADSSWSIIHRDRIWKHHAIMSACQA